MARLSAISLFTGCGGLDYGFEAAGFDTRVAVEMDARCVETLTINRDWRVISKDIGRVTSAELLEAAGLAVGEADVLIGGPPCQPFSKAAFWATGSSKRLNDPRASTLDHYLRILEDTQPRAFLLENVEGLGFRGKDEGLTLIESALTEINARAGTSYRASIAVLNAADYGVPQLRRRLFVVGARDGASFSFPRPTHGEGKAQSWRTAWDALWDLGEPDDETLVIKGKWAGLLPSIPEGQNYLWHTDRGGGLPLFGWRRRFWSFLLKLAKDQPSWTLAAQPGPATGPFHWNSRRLSMREMARLQTFPDEVQVLGSVLDVQRQLGNAVPSLLAEVLGHAMREQFLHAAKNPDLALRVSRSPIAPPKAASIKRIPKTYLKLAGTHAAHPGTGLGFGMQRRLELIAVE